MHSDKNLAHGFLLGIRSAIALIAVIALIFTSTVAFAQEANRFIPDSACGALVVKPKVSFEQPSLDLIPHELLDAFGKTELGLDLLDLSRMTFLVDKFENVNSPPDFGIVFEFDSDQKIGGNMGGELQPGQLDGVDGEVFVIPGPDAPLVVQIDSKTILIGTEPMLRKMTAAAGGSSPLISMINGMPETDHANIFVDIESIRQPIIDNLPPADQMRPEMRRFRILPELIKSVSVRHSFNEGGISEVRVASNNAEDAEKLEFLLISGVDFAKNAMLEEAGFTGDQEWGGFGDEDYDDAMIAYADRIAELVKVEIRTARDGNDLMVDLNSLPGLNSMMTFSVMPGLLFGMARPVMMGGGPMGGPGGIVAMDDAFDAPMDSEEQLRTIIIAMHNYHDVNGSFPAQAIADENGNPLLSWRVAILPYIEQNALYEQFHLDEPWDSEHNIKLLDTIPAVYVSPMIDLGSDTVFLGVAGEGMTFGAKEGVDLGNVKDGTSNTIGLVEADAAAAVPWTKPVDLQVDLENPRKNLGGIHETGFFTAFLDGSTRFAPVDIDPENLKILFLTNDGNWIEIDW